LSVESDRHVCDSTSNQFYLGSLSMANSPYSLRLTVARSQANCPILESTL